MFGKKTITRSAIVATLALAAFGATAASALADGGTAYFGMDNQGHYGTVQASTPECNRYTHHAIFDVWVQQPPQYPNGIWFSDAVYVRDVTTGGAWQWTGGVDKFIKTVNGAINQSIDYSRTNYVGIAGHSYQFKVNFTWGLPGGYWKPILYFLVGPYTSIYGDGTRISGSPYCRL